MIANPANPMDGLLAAAPAAAMLERAETRALIARLAGEVQVRDWLRELVPLLPPGVPDELGEYLRLGLLGICAGFLERALSPYHPQHMEIVAPMLEEIRAVYDQLHRQGSPYDADEFRYRAFHYGLHKACYLDWRLYLSNTCY